MTELLERDDESESVAMVKRLSRLEEQVLIRVPATLA